MTPSEYDDLLGESHALSAALDESLRSLKLTLDDQIERVHELILEQRPTPRAMGVVDLQVAREDAAAMLAYILRSQVQLTGRNWLYLNDRIPLWERAGDWLVEYAGWTRSDTRMEWGVTKFVAPGEDA